MVHPQGGERSPVESQGIISYACDIQNICDLEKECKSWGDPFDDDT